MELVSAAKMRKSQALALAGRPYNQSLHEIFSNVQTASGQNAHKLLKTNKSPNELLIIITSDRGLAGGINLNIFREILRLGSTSDSESRRVRSEPKNTKYITVGKKATDFAVKTKGDLIASYMSEEIPFLTLARILTKTVIESFVKEEFSKISLIYPHFDSTIKQTPRFIQLLPIAPQADEGAQTVPAEFLFEPNPDSILESILTHHVLIQIYQVLVEAKASEFSARMVAMKNATDAAEDLVSDLTLTYNQARQESITKELLDIVTAQKAFE